MAEMSQEDATKLLNGYSEMAGVNGYPEMAEVNGYANSIEDDLKDKLNNNEVKIEQEPCVMMKKRMGLLSGVALIVGTMIGKITWTVVLVALLQLTGLISCLDYIR